MPFYFAWSLATEEQFYLLWPPLLVATLMIGRRRIWVPLAALVVLVVISQGASLVTDTSELPGRIPASLSLPILLGAAAALVTSNARGFAVVAWALGRAWSAPVAALLLVAALALDARPQATQVPTAAVVISTCLVEWTPLHPMLQWRPVAFVGVISYGVYLLHMLSANLDRRVIHQQFGVLLTAMTLVTAVAAAYLSFRFFETPLLRVKRRFETKEQRQGDELSRIVRRHSG